MLRLRVWAALAALMAGIGYPNAASASPEAAWLVVVIFNGDNDLDSYAKEAYAEATMISTPGVQTALLLDHHTGWASNLETWSPLAGKDSDPNLSSGEEIAGFFRTAVEAYPAARRVLVLWGHMQGWNFNASGVNDDSAPLDPFSNLELADALREVLGGKQLNILGFDGCFMAMIENAFAYRNVADLLAGSQGVVPYAGWDYAGWLTRMRAKTDVEEAATIIVDTFRERYKETADNQAVTISVLDTRQASNAVDRVNALARGLVVAIDEESPAVKRARDGCAKYGPEMKFRYHFIDLIRFCERLTVETTNEDLRTHAENTIAAVRGLIVANYAGKSRQGAFGSNGVSIYFPASGVNFKSDISHHGYGEEARAPLPIEFAKDYAWDDFLKAYYTRVVR